MARIVTMGALLLVAVLLAACGSSLGTAPGSSGVRPMITFGTLDGTGHPNVGALVIEWGTPAHKVLFCSGTLIAPQVFLTAAHCTAWIEAHGIANVWVTFDTHFDPVTSTFIAGTMHTNPGYNQRQSDPGDVAVITLASAPAGITPATLPTAGQFTQMARQNGLKRQKFTAVGYGVLQPTTGNGPPTFPDTSDRHRAVSTFNAINPAWLRLSQNPATGNGGTCYGDSGGPNFLGAGSGETTVVAAQTVTGDAMCRATNVVYRLDTPAARAFLAGYVTLP